MLPPMPGAELKKQRPEMLAPLAAPSSLPPLPQAAAEAAGDGSDGLGLSAAQLRQLAADAYAAALHPQLLPAAAATQGLGAAASSGSSLSSYSEDDQAGRLVDRLAVPTSSSSGAAAPAPAGRGSWEAEVAAEIAAGEGPVLQALGSYFRHLETTAEAGATGSSSQDEQAALAGAVAEFDAPATPDGCFPALFGRWGLLLCPASRAGACVGCGMASLLLHCCSQHGWLGCLKVLLHKSLPRRTAAACRALALGVVSKRRLYAEAAAVLEQQPEQAQPESLNPLAQVGGVRGMRSPAWLIAHLQ